MIFGFLVRKLDALDGSLSTVHLMTAACNAGHEVLVCEAGSFSQLDTGALSVPGIWLRSKTQELSSHQVAAAVHAKARTELRPYDLGLCSILFPRIIWSPEEIGNATLLNLLSRLEDQGCHVINRVEVLRRFASAHHWAEFPTAVQPRHLITRDLTEAQAWLAAQGDSDVFARGLHQRSGTHPIRVAAADPQLEPTIQGILAQDAAVLFTYPVQAPEKRILWMDGKILGGYATSAPAWTGRGSDAPVRPFISDMNEAEAAVYLQVEPVLKALQMNLAMIAIADNVLTGIEAMAPGGIDCINRLYNCRVENSIVRQAVRQFNAKSANRQPETASTAE